MSKENIKCTNCGKNGTKKYEFRSYNYCLTHYEDHLDAEDEVETFLYFYALEMLGLRPE